MSKSSTVGDCHFPHRLLETTTVLAADRSENPLPSEHATQNILTNLREILFPGSSGELQQSPTKEDVRTFIEDTRILLENVLLIAFHATNNAGELARNATDTLLHALPALRDILMEDANAALQGDPAAKNTDDIILNYPGFRALTVQRIAHLLHTLEVPLVPRQMTESAHRDTGIDIHPGAVIDEGFFIDHGTGVVIGETAIIGKKVRIYQGVTLGAGTDPVKAGHTKRHPTLQDNVTCFANSGVFGPVTIGLNSVIGAGADVFTDIPANRLVLAPKPELIVRNRK